jgi:hypothetical protein
VEDGKKESGSGYSAQIPVDARQFLTEMGEVDLGVFQVKNLHLSIRDRSAPANSYYTCAASAAFS